MSSRGDGSMVSLAILKVENIPFGLRRKYTCLAAKLKAGKAFDTGATTSG